MTTGGNLGATASTSNLYCDAAGEITAIRQQNSGTAGDERQCFYYDQQQRLARGYTTANPNGACPTSAPSNSTTPAGHAPYNAGYTYTSATPWPTTTAAPTRTPRQLTVMPVGHQRLETQRTVGHRFRQRTGGREDWHDCNGSIMARTSGTNSRTSYAWDDNNRLCVGCSLRTGC